MVFQSRGTFGNLDTLRDSQLLAFEDNGQAIDSAVYDAARSSLIENTFLEYFSGKYTLNSYIHFAGGIVGNVNFNHITGSAVANPLRVDGPYNVFNVIGNDGYGNILGTVNYSGNSYFYNGAPLRQIIHNQGNAENLDLNFPFNSQASEYIPYQNGLAAFWSPSTDGLTYNSYGQKVTAVNNEFRLDLMGRENFLDFSSQYQRSVTGTFNVYIWAYQANAGAV